MFGIYAKHYRGFLELNVNMRPVTFLVGDNSSGKTSILHLIDVIQNTELSYDLVINEGHHADQRDIFSPYFEGKPVTVAFHATAKEGLMTKVITAVKEENGYARIESCTFVSDQVAVSTKIRRGRPYLRIAAAPETRGLRSAVRLNADSSGFTGVKTKIRRVRINSPDGAYPLVLDSMGNSEGEDDEVFQAINGKVNLPGAVFLGPLRAMPEKYYKSVRRYDASGSHFATMWIDIPEEVRGAVNRDVEKFGEESGLFDKIIVKQIDEDIHDPPVFIYVERNGHKFTLDQVGIGVSQVVPVLVQAAVFRATRQKTQILLQQPELHLHPRAQAALGSYIAKCATDGVNFVIETHSDFLIDRFRSHMRDDKVLPQASIVFCEGTANGNRAYEMIIEKDGSITKMHSGYRAFFKKEFARTLF